MKTAGNDVINHEGIVKSNSGESVIISITSQSACAGCHARGSCGLIGSEVKDVEVKGAYNVKPGEMVYVLMNQSMGFTALSYGYVIPFVVILIMLFLMISLRMSELIAGLISLGTLIPYYFTLYSFRDKLGDKFSFTIKDR
jgi:sigma-E factor negative regulatory protein RseC